MQENLKTLVKCQQVWSTLNTVAAAAKATRVGLEAKIFKYIFEYVFCLGTFLNKKSMGMVYSSYQLI